MVSFKELLREEENAAKAGYKNGAWFPHVSPERGTRTVGYGHKLSQEEEDGNYVVLPNGKIVDFSQRGLTDAEVDIIFEADIQKKRSLAATQWDAAQKTPFSSLKPLHQTLLTEIAFNSIGGLKNRKGKFGWPKLAKGILADDTEVVKKEIERTFVNEKGVREPLEKRVNRIKAFIDEYEADPNPSLLAGFVPDEVPQGLEQPVDEPQLAYSNLLNDLTNQLNPSTRPPLRRSQSQIEPPSSGRKWSEKEEKSIERARKLLNQEESKEISRRLEGERKLAQTYREVTGQEEKEKTVWSDKDEKQIAKARKLLSGKKIFVDQEEPAKPTKREDNTPIERERDDSKDPIFGIF